jgi:hypothetical protein
MVIRLARTCRGSGPTPSAGISAIFFKLRRAQDDAAIAGPRDRGADNRLAETGVVPADDSAAIGIVHFDDDVATALGGGELRLAVGRGTELEPARRRCGRT